MEPNPVQPKDSNKSLYIVIAVLVLILLAAVASWYFYLQNRKTEPNTESKKVATTSTNIATTSTQTEIPVDDTALIKKALVAKTTIAEDMLDFSVSTKEGNYAKGSVGTKGEETGGGYFLATKVNNDWVIVYSGQANPECSAINPYNFPTSMVPECMDANNEVVKR